MVSRDLLWKGIITSLVDDFLAFFYPEAFPLLDLDKGVEFLDKELEQLFPDSKENQRFVDKLIKVFQRDGQERFFLVHVEVQGYIDPNFSERMFIYFYRLFDHYLAFIIHYQPFFESKMSRKFEENLNVMDATKGLVELIKEEMIRQNREAGRVEGLAEGREEGLTEGREEGFAKGREEGREEVIRQLLQNGLNLEEVARLVQMPVKDLRKILNGPSDKD